MSRTSSLSPSDVLFQASNAPKLVFSRGSSPRTPLGELTTLPYPLYTVGDTPQTSGEGDTPHTLPLDLGAYGASVHRPPPRKIPGYAYDCELALFTVVCC